MLLKRNFACEIYEDQLDGDISDDARIVDVSDSPTQKEVIGVVPSCGGGQLAASGSLTVPLPDGYTNASYLHVTIRCEGLIKIAIASPDHTTSNCLCQGSSTSPGMHQVVEHVNSITITNTSATTAVKIGYALFTLPDISDEDEFRGLQTDGSQTEVT